MDKIEKMKESSIYKMGLLGILCAVCGLLLSVVNSITAPVIKENQLAKVKTSLEVIFPDGDFEDVTEKYISNDETGLVDAVYTADGEGVIFSLNGIGYSSSGMTFMVGFDNDGKIAGFLPLEQSETNGIGSKVFDPEFADTYKGVGLDDEIPMMSGATLTSGAVKAGIQAAQAMLPAVQGK